MKRVKIILILIMVTALGSCETHNKKKGEPKRKEDPGQKTNNKIDEKCKLISSSNTLLINAVSEEGNAYDNNRDSFIEKYKSENYKSGILTVKTVQEIDPCAQEVGTIKFENDRIKLLTKLTKDISCNSIELHIFTYKIKTDKKYPVTF